MSEDELIDLFGNYFDECEFNQDEINQCIKEFEESSEEDQENFISYMVTVVNYEMTFDDHFEEFLDVWKMTLMKELELIWHPLF